MLSIGLSLNETLGTHRFLNNRQNPDVRAGTHGVWNLIFLNRTAFRRDPTSCPNLKNFSSLFVAFDGERFQNSSPTSFRSARVPKAFSQIPSFFAMPPFWNQKRQRPPFLAAAQEKRPKKGRLHASSLANFGWFPFGMPTLKHFKSCMRSIDEKTGHSIREQRRTKRI